MVKDYSDRREETCCHHFISHAFQLAARIFYMHILQTGQYIPWSLITNCNAMVGTGNSSTAPSKGITHTHVKDHSDSEKENTLPPHRLLLSINSKGSFICTIPVRITHTTAFVTPVVEHWLEKYTKTFAN